MILHRNIDRSIDTVSGSATNSPSQDEKVWSPGRSLHQTVQLNRPLLPSFIYVPSPFFSKVTKLWTHESLQGIRHFQTVVVVVGGVADGLGGESQSRRLTLSVHIIYFLRFFILLGGFQSTNSPRDESQGFAVGVFRRYRRYNDNVKLVRMQSWPTRPPVLVRREHRWLDDLRNLLWEFGFGDEKACLGGFCFNLSFEDSKHKNLVLFLKNFNLNIVVGWSKKKLQKCLLKLLIKYLYNQRDG